MIQIFKVLSIAIKNKIRFIKGAVYENDSFEYEQATIPGIDCGPLPDDSGLIMNICQTSDNVIFGIIQKNASVQPGEIKIYSRDANKNIKSVIYLTKNGTIEINNAITIGSDGAITMNADLTVNGTITGNAVKTALGKDLDLHTHNVAGVTTGGSTVPTTPPL